MWPPCAIITERHRCLIEKITFRQTFRGIVLHSSSKAFRSIWSDVGWRGRFLILLSSSSHKCSMGLRSGDFAGHGRTGIPKLVRWSVVIRAVWGLALSCMSVKWGLLVKSGTISDDLIYPLILMFLTHQLHTRSKVINLNLLSTQKGKHNHWWTHC